MDTELFSTEITTITALNLASVYDRAIRITNNYLPNYASRSFLSSMNYSEEQLRRKAHLESGGTLENYDRSHYPQKEEKENETNNN